MVGQLGVDLVPDLGVLDHVLVHVHALTVDDEEEVERQARVMLGVAGNRHVLLHVLLAVLLGEVVDDALLLLDASVRGVEVYVHALVLEVLLEPKVGVIGLFLDVDVPVLGVLEAHDRYRILPASRELVRLVDQRLVVDGTLLRGIDRRLLCACLRLCGLRRLVACTTTQERKAKHGSHGHSNALRLSKTVHRQAPLVQLILLSADRLHQIVRNKTTFNLTQQGGWHTGSRVTHQLPRSQCVIFK